jgi:hypothetical protein
MTITVPGLNETDLKKINQAIQQLSAGRSNAVGVVTLAVSPATSTTVTDRNCAAGTVPILVPTTANAAAAQATNYIPKVTIGNGSFVIQHASSAQVDRTFIYALHG